MGASRGHRGRLEVHRWCAPGLLATRDPVQARARRRHTPCPQVFCGMWIFLGALFLEIYGEPYCNATIAALARMSICTLLLTLSIASAYLWDIPTWAEVLVAVLLVISMIAPVYIFIYNLIQTGIGKAIAWIVVCPGAPHTARSPVFPAGLSSRTPLFFLLRTAPKDHQPPTANRHQPPTANRQPPTIAQYYSCGRVLPVSRP